MKARKWDMGRYTAGDEEGIGVVLEVFENGDVRTDTDGMRCASEIISIEPVDGKHVIYSSREYRESLSYRKWLWEHYGLPIKEV
jgi:hypothetical protein